MFGITKKESDPVNPPQQENDARAAAHPDQDPTQPTTAPAQGQEPLMENFTNDIYVKKEVSQVGDDGEATEYVYTRKDGRVIYAAAKSELMKQLDMQIEQQAPVNTTTPSPEGSVNQPKTEPALDANERGAVVAGHAAPNGPETEPVHAFPEFRVLDLNGNVVRSYNAGVHGEAAEDNAHKFAAKVSGTVRRFDE